MGADTRFERTAAAWRPALSLVGLPAVLMGWPVLGTAVVGGCVVTFVACV